MLADLVSECSAVGSESEIGNPVDCNNGIVNS